jgi:hypothetical protein
MAATNNDHVELAVEHLMRIPGFARTLTGAGGGIKGGRDG